MIEKTLTQLAVIVLMILLAVVIATEAGTMIDIVCKVDLINRSFE